MPDRRRRIAALFDELKTGCLMTVALAVVLVIGLEAWLRWAPPEQWTEQKLLAGRPPEQRLVQPHPYLTYVLTPSFRKPGVRHNAFGYRGPEIDDPKQPGVVRVLCLGGSSTYGVGASSNLSTWPGQLQLALERAHPAAPVEVINAGVPGYTSFESLLDLALRGVPLAPDILVVYQGFNDLRAATREADQVVSDNSHYRQRWTAPGADTNGILRHARSALLARWLLTSFRSQVADLAEYVVVDAHAPQFVTPVGDVALASYRRNLAQLVAVARTAEARVLIVTQAYGEATIHPDEIDIVDDGMAAFAQIARDIVAAQEDPAVALLDARRILPRFYGSFAEIDHLTDYGAGVLGALVSDELSTLGWWPPHSPASEEVD